MLRASLTYGFYTVAFVASLAYSFGAHDKTRSKSGLITLFSVFIAWLIQGAALGLTVAEPMRNAPVDAFELVAWGLALSFMLFSVSTRLSRIIPIFTSAILIFMTLSLYFGAAFPLAIEATPKIRLWGSLHLLFSFLGFTALLVQALVALLYLLKERSLKRKSFSLIEGLPPLDQLHRFSSQLLWVGFLFLSAGLLSGGGWSKILHRVYFTADPRETMTLIVWISYTALVLFRASAFFKGRRLMWASLLSFAGLLFSFGVSHRP